MKETFQSFWSGKLTELEIISLVSFARHGHEVHLYTYDDLKVPECIKIKDANEIIDEVEYFETSHFNEKSPFSDLFRYKLLKEKEVGG